MRRREFITLLAEHANAPHALNLLCTHGERPNDCAGWPSTEATPGQRSGSPRSSRGFRTSGWTAARNPANGRSLD